MGPFDEINDTTRIEYINKIAQHIPPDDNVEPGFYAFLWLSDIEKLRAYAETFVANDAVSRVQAYEDRGWTRSLKIWAIRDHDRKDGPPMEDSATGSKRKLTSGGNPRQPSPTKAPCSQDTRKDSRTSPALSPIVMSPTPGQGSRSPSKLPKPVGSLSQPATPATPATPTTPVIPGTPGSVTPGPKSYSRSAMMRDKCLERDNGLCVVTRGADCNQVAHIYPYTLGVRAGDKGYNRFWDMMRLFWSDDKIIKWESSVLGGTRTEIVPNLMCLSQLVHRLWSKARFALQPHEPSQDGKTMEAEFYWLPDFKYEFRDLRTPPPNPTSMDSTTKGTSIMDCPTKRCIQSGDVITLTTDDPHNLPLPSKDILDMQWILNRLVALAGAADVSDEELDPDDPMGLAPLISAGYELGADSPTGEWEGGVPVEEEEQEGEV